MCHGSWRQRVHEDARNALEIGNAAQSDAQPDTSLWKAEQSGGWGL